MNWNNSNSRQPADENLPESLRESVTRMQALEPTRESVNRARVRAQHLSEIVPPVDDHRWRRLLPASAVLAASIALLVTGTSLFNAADTAFAQVQEAIHELEHVTITSFREYNGKQVAFEKVQATRDHIRTERPNGLVTVTSAEDAKEMSINPYSQTVEIYPLYDAMLAGQRIDRVFRLIARVPSSAVRKERNGSDAETQYIIDWEGRKLAVWVRDGERLPDRMKVLEVPEEDPSLLGQIYYVDGSPIADDVFAFDPPEGYEVVLIAASSSTSSHKLKLVPGVGFEGLNFGSSLGEVLGFLGEPDGTKRHATMDETNLTADNIDTIRDANASGAGQDLAMNPLAGGLPVRWSNELIYDSKGFRVIVDERDGLEMIRAYGEGKLGGGRNRGFKGILAGDLKLGASPEDVIAVYGRPAIPSDMDTANHNGHLRYREPYVNFGFFDFHLATVEIRNTGAKTAAIRLPRR